MIEDLISNNTWNSINRVNRINDLNINYSINKVNVFITI
jgi:hypothetical protein